MRNMDIPGINLKNMMAHIDIPQSPIIKEPKFIKSDTKSVLIIGNGFDLDLGMKTSYMHYANSKYWPFRNNKYQKEGTLPRFLNDKRDLERWLDIEAALAEYANNHLINQDIEEDKQYFEMLVEGLHKYLQNEQDSLNITNEKSGPAAKIILENIIKKQDYSIYSFNYTNLFYLANKMMVNIDPNRINYVHGSLSNNNIIIGTGDVEDLPDEYSWLYKSFNPNYKSNNLVEDLSDADEIYIFGHSLGKNDFDYFIDFFQSAIHERKKTILFRRQ